MLLLFSKLKSDFAPPRANGEFILKKWGQNHKDKKTEGKIIIRIQSQNKNIIAS